MSTTLLLEAVDAGDEETVMRVLNAYPEAYQEGGCLFGNILLCERDRVTLLMRAALVGHLEVLKLLACRGGAINALSHLDRTALYYAAQEGHEEVVAYLLSNGADPMRLDEFGCTPLVSASMRGHLGVVLLLLEHMGEQGLEARDHEDGHTALHWAVWQGHEEVVAHLLRHGARADTMSSSGKSTLRAAVSHGHVGVVRLLVNHLGPQALQEADVQGRTLLHLAVHMSHEDVTTFLLRKGLRTDARDNRGDTPLLVSAMRGPLAVMLRVLEHMDGQGLDLGDNYGRTALHLAVIGHCPENVLALLLAGADYTIMDVRGATAHAMAEVEAGDEGFGFPECAHVFRVSAHASTFMLGPFLRHTTPVMG
jgi:ankyrin repeat protein